jgi:hypothetical protein
MHTFTEVYSSLSSEDGSDHRIAGKGAPLGAFALLFATHMRIVVLQVSVYHREQVKR